MATIRHPTEAVTTVISPELKHSVIRAMKRSQDYFARTQSPEGYWWGELESNSTMEAEYLLLTHFLGVGDADTWRKLANHIFETQRADGTWGQYYGSPGDLSTTIECYFALKLAGASLNDPRMAKARVFIVSRGGIPKARVFTKIWLALFGQWSWDAIPALPPEMILLPSWVPMNLYDFSSWARGTILPLSIVLTHRPVRPIPEYAVVPELVPRGSNKANDIPGISKLARAQAAFHLVDWLLRRYNSLPWQPLRRLAISKAERWIIEHQEEDGSWGGIQPPWVYSLIALSILGYDVRHPVMRKGIKGFKNFAIEENDSLRMQACVSPVWDTCLAMIALSDSSIPPDSPMLQRAGEWLMRAQVSDGGDWQIKARHASPGGWSFEFSNCAYPDIDDTAEALIALDKVKLRDVCGKNEAIRRGAEWLLGVQSKSGGWGAFDKDNTRRAVAKMPFADFGEMIDPPSADVTAHVVEALVQIGYPLDAPPLSRAVQYLISEQEPDGSWFGRWGVNYIYGTGAVLPSLKAAGADTRSEQVRRAVDWLTTHQNADGGWGESCASYADPALAGKGHSTPSQTAWALIALMAADETKRDAIRSGIKYLIKTQRDDGTWEEKWYTGTGFPGYGTGDKDENVRQQGSELSAGFMIRYDLYRNYWPLMALGRFWRLCANNM